MTLLPRNWALVKLGEAGAWMGGGTPAKHERAFWGGTVPWVSPKDMKTSRIRDSEDHITDEAITRSTTGRVARGSVLIVVRSGILAHTLPVAIADVEVTVNQDLKALTPVAGIFGDYLAWALRAFGTDILSRCKKDGTTVASVDYEALRSYEIPLAPTNEQQRVVDAVESYLSRLDAAVASLQGAQAKLKAYRASVLKAAIEGRLVRTEAELARAENRGYEPADVLLKRILAERRRRWEKLELARMEAAGRAPKDDKWKAKYEEPIAVATCELPGLREGWCWATLPQLGELSRGKSMHRPRNDPRLLGGPYPFIQTGEVKAADTWIRTYIETYSELGLAQSKLWPAGTMCITIAANIAATAILTFDACFPDSVVGFVQSESTITRYVEMFIRTARQDLDRYAPATAQKNINLQTLSEVAVPLPPLAEQNRNSRTLSALAALVTTCRSFL